MEREKRNVHMYVVGSSIFVLALKGFFLCGKNEDIERTYFWDVYRKAISLLTMRYYVLNQFPPLSLYLYDRFISNDQARISCSVCELMFPILVYQNGSISSKQY